jgi:hypothetical protein
MIDNATIEQWIREANPIPDVDDVDADEFARFVAAADRRRAAIMQAPTQHPTPTSPVTPPPSSRRKVWAFAAGFLVILLVVGAAALFLRGDDTPVADEPAPPTTLREEPEAAINVDSLSWTRITLGSEGPSLAITEGGPGLIGLGLHKEPDPDDEPPGVGGEGEEDPRIARHLRWEDPVVDGQVPSGWVQGTLDIPTVWTSPDGYEWNRIPQDEAFDLDGAIADIAAGDSGLVAVADQYVWTSPDGVTWSRLAEGITFTENTGGLRGVIAGGPGFVAFGERVPWGSAVWISPDGLAWTRVPDDPAVFSANMEAMTVGGPGLVAVGYDETTSNPAVWTSPDGYTWTRVPHDPAVFGEGDPDEMISGMRINDVAAGETGLVAVGADLTESSPDELKIMAAVWTSPDGVTWTRVPHDPALFEGEEVAAMTGVAAVGDGFVAIGDEVWTSRDGTNWTRSTDVPVITDTDGMRHVIAAGPGVIILGIDGLGPYSAVDDYPDVWTPTMETVIWIGSPGQPTG